MINSHRWILIHTVDGSTGCVRGRHVIAAVVATCDEPAHPRHYLIDIPGARLEVSRQEFLRVASELGLDPSAFPEEMKPAGGVN